MCLHIVMYYYIHMINHESVNQCIHTYIYFHWKEHYYAKCYPVPITLSSCLPRSYDVGTTSMPFLLRWYYVTPVLTTLSLGPYNVF